MSKRKILKNECIHTSFIRKQATDVPEMTLDDINAEIQAVRAERKR